MALVYIFVGLSFNQSNLYLFNFSKMKQGEAMRKMAHLRLKDQVETLQRGQTSRGNLSPSSGSLHNPSKQDGPHQVSSMLSGTSNTSLHDVSPYLILDTFCFVGHLPFVKRLLASQRFVLVVPQAGNGYLYTWFLKYCVIDLILSG